MSGREIVGCHAYASDPLYRLDNHRRYIALCNFSSYGFNVVERQECDVAVLVDWCLDLWVVCSLDCGRSTAMEGLVESNDSAASGVE